MDALLVAKYPPRKAIEMSEDMLDVTSPLDELLKPRPPRKDVLVIYRDKINGKTAHATWYGKEENIGGDIESYSYGYDAEIVSMDDVDLSYMPTADLTAQNKMLAEALLALDTVINRCLPVSSKTQKEHAPAITLAKQITGEK